ncbi:hypothetical protein PNA2_0146 [Pyrococcus sp. NA2]|uniref:hypothetical protein n=1 Tax=Pyrococcus sp. (strain NA2) TaxID=342949 RepID=UPI000209AEC3|nr:hypothetical protein [Pyrococcus sp. NA2]AEC51064.1 hypothetical protein PNA2_0146 [Pyrococcus sp. NA2]
MKRMLVLYLTLMIMTTLVSAMENDIPKVTRITPGVKTEYWTIEGVKLYTVAYGPWQVAAINHCDEDAECSVSKTVEHCMSVSVYGSIKVGIEVIEAEVGVTVGKTYCESTACSVTCIGKDALLEWRYVEPIKQIIQRKHIVYPDGHEELGETAYAYVRMNAAPECRSSCI